MGCAGPSREDIAAAARRAKDTALGPDGLRYAAWRRAGRVAWESLGGFMWAVMGGAALPEVFVATLLFFLPKNVLPTEVGEVWRDAPVLRPSWGCRTRTPNSCSTRSTLRCRCT